MKCEELLQALNEYVDGERGLAICKTLEKHLADCNPCQVVVDNVRKTIALYKAGELMELPPEVHSQLNQLLRERWKQKFPQSSVSE